MSETRFDVLGIGSAIVDILAHADEALLASFDLVKGCMALTSAEKAKQIYDRMGRAMEISGGSAANTMAGIASLGGTPAFIGKVGTDKLGEIFKHEIEAIGVDFHGGHHAAQLPTATCLILVTDDGQRTMNTHLGASTTLGPDDIDEARVAASRVTYIEGYQWDTPQAKEAIRKASKAAKAAGRHVALSLSDPFVVDRHREDLLTLIREDVDILFGNEEEIFRLYHASDLETAIERLKGAKVLACMTRGAKGAVVFDGNTTAAVDAAPVAKVVDTTGAGDLFAAGFLYGYTHGRDLMGCAKIGVMAAAEVISHMGARPEVPLRDLLLKQGL
jgi:sugar/nucleoside kinase (ribokinase family)